MTDLEIANEILRQIGGNKFIAMTGAKNLVAGPSSLSFKLPNNFAKDGINHVAIALKPNDLYDIAYSRLWGTKFAPLYNSTDLYCDMLTSDFTAITGLDCSMGNLLRGA
ncbi:MAG: hypothetical protein COA69_13485 [Robiginitomaculum sp.]|nr:MAG: hypothetical protein COA69_13485 [Robiginitomaculum sp.]